MDSQEASLRYRIEHHIEEHKRCSRFASGDILPHLIERQREKYKRSALGHLSQVTRLENKLKRHLSRKLKTQNTAALYAYFDALNIKIFLLPEFCFGAQYLFKVAISFQTNCAEYPDFDNQFLEVPDFKNKKEAFNSRGEAEAAGFDMAAKIEALLYPKTTWENPVAFPFKDGALYFLKKKGTISAATYSAADDTLTELSLSMTPKWPDDYEWVAIPHHAPTENATPVFSASASK